MHSLGIYVQVPFCASKCSFCNFSSRVEASSVFDRYTGALVQEIDRLRVHYEALGLGESICTLPVDTVYFGGGTPPMLGAEKLEKIVGALGGRFEMSGVVEFTVEATPGSADRQFLERALGMGVNRLSIGAQTFEDEELRAVGRLHSASDTRELVETARGKGFTNLSIDLVAGLPHQTSESWRRSLEAALRLAPQHISLYLFEIDEKSRLGREVMHGGSRYHASTVPGEEFMADAYESGREALGREGYIQYEISNFALPGYESRHNLKYWQRAPYVGFGAGAHSFDGLSRWANLESAESYMNELASERTPIADVAGFRCRSRWKSSSSWGCGRRKASAWKPPGNSGGRTRSASGKEELKRWPATAC